MIFKAERVELETDDRWLLPSDLGFEVGYDSLAELYLATLPHYQQALEDEFEALALAEQDGATLAEALSQPKVARPESTYMASMLIKISRIIEGPPELEFYLELD